MKNARTALLVALALLAGGLRAHAAEILWRDGDTLPIPEPAVDDDGDSIWWDGARSMTFYQVGRLADLGNSIPALGHFLGLVGPDEARNLNALDEVPDSTWFTNRHGRVPLPAATLARGPNLGPPPAPDGPLEIQSGKALGATPGFIARDRLGQRFVFKFDPPDVPELATGAEIVCSKILWALGWNVPEYHLVDLDPARLRIKDGATVKGKYGVKRLMTPQDVDDILAKAARQENGRIRAIASKFIVGKPIGSPLTQGSRPDDANDTIPHEDRRELRGLRIVAAWLNYTDARRGNFFDSFVKHENHPEGHGHVVHYLLDFSSALGSGNVEWKSPKFGHEYFFDPAQVGKSLLGLGLYVKPWEPPNEITHPALGYFQAQHFDPETWKTSFPQPLFDQATARDEFWGAKLVASLSDEDLQAVIAAGEWSDPAAAELLHGFLRERQRRIAATYFSTDRINPLAHFVVQGNRLLATDLGVTSGVASASSARYRVRGSDRRWRSHRNPAFEIAPGNSISVEIQTSHDAGSRWSPTTRVRAKRDSVGAWSLVAVERE